MAISVDDSVARWTGTPNNGGTAVSGSFTPANNSLLVCCINGDESPGPNTVTPSGGGWTWTERVNRGQTDAGEGIASIWTAPVTTGASMQITLTRGGEVGSRRVSGKVYIVTSQHASPIGNNNEANWTTNPQTLAVTAAGAGRLFGSGTDWNQTGTPVSTDVEDGADYASQISVMSAYKSADHASGSQSIQFDPVGTPSGNVVVLEILAAASSGAISGTSSLAFSATATLQGAAAIAGTAALAFSPTAALTGPAAIAGASALTFTTTAQISGPAQIAGTAAIAFSPSASLAGPASIAGTAALTFSATASMGTAGAISGSAALVFSPVASLLGPASVSGTAALAFTPTAALQGPASIAGAAALSFTVNGQITSGNLIAGATALTFAPTASIVGVGRVSGTSVLGFSAVGALTDANQTMQATTRILRPGQQVRAVGAEGSRIIRVTQGSRVLQ